MKNKTKKAILLCSLIIGMIFYIGWVFYKSEPIYIDNCYKQQLQKYDYVSIPGPFGGVQNGIILQVDSMHALVKTHKQFIMFTDNRFYELDTKNKSSYRIIGKGTIYHKVNNYIGFNIMLISQIMIGILCAIFMRITYNTLDDLF